MPCARVPCPLPRSNRVNVALTQLPAPPHPTPPHPTQPRYLTAFDELILPAAASFAPDLIVVSAGFDAAEGDPLGTYHLSPTAYAHMTRRLQALPSSEGRVVAVLEGGYNLESISASASAVCTALRGAEDAPCVQVCNCCCHCCCHCRCQNT